MPSTPPPSSMDGPLGLRLATAVGAAVGASAIAAAPATLRLGAGAVSPQVWIALVALALGPMILAVLVLRRARAALLAFGGPRGPARLTALVLFVALFFTVLVALGAVLRATTHHHPLAGVTFALVALFVGVGLVPIAIRLATLVHGEGLLAHRLAPALLVTLAFLPAALLVHRARGAMPSTSLATAVDLLAFAMTALFASRPALGARRLLAFSGPPLALLALVVGLRAVLAASPSVAELDTHAPAFAPVAGLVVRH